MSIQHICIYKKKIKFKSVLLIAFDPFGCISFRSAKLDLSIQSI